MQAVSFGRRLRQYRLLWLPVLLGGIAALCYPQLLAAEAFAARHFIQCPFHTITGLHCPGCGGTRSFTALLHGDFLLALHENPATPLLVLTILLWYLEHVGAVFGKNWHLVPRRKAFWFVLLALHLVWAVLRNFIPALMPFSPVA